MLKSPALGVVVTTALFAALVFPSSVNSQENPAGQKAFSAGPAGVYSLSVVPGPKAGQVTLSWKQARADLQSFHIVYGTSPNNFTYGSLNIGGNVPIGKSISFTINYLKPGTKYFFALSPVSGGIAQPFTFQVASTPKPGVVTPPSAPGGGSPTPTASLTGPVLADSLGSQSKAAIKANGVGLHQLSVKKGAKPNEVILQWKQAFGNVDNYDIVYGTQPGKFQYGAQNVGKTTSFAIKGLNPNKQYYFALVPKSGGQAQYITQQVTTAGAAVAKVEEIKVSSGAPSTPGPAAAGAGGGGAGGGGGQQGVPSGGGAGGGAGQPANVGAPGTSGQSGQPGGGGGGGKQEEKKPEPKKSKKHKGKEVKGTSIENFDLIEWLKSIFLR